MIFKIFCFKVPRWDDCSADATLLRNGTECRFGTLNDQQTMAVISFTGYLIYGGCFAATLSSAIASLVGKYTKLQILFFQSGKFSGVCINVLNSLKTTQNSEMYSFFLNKHTLPPPPQTQNSDFRNVSVNLFS